MPDNDIHYSYSRPLQEIFRDLESQGVSNSIKKRCAFIEHKLAILAEQYVGDAENDTDRYRNARAGVNRRFGSDLRENPVSDERNIRLLSSNTFARYFRELNKAEFVQGHLLGILQYLIREYLLDKRVPLCGSIPYFLVYSRQGIYAVRFEDSDGKLKMIVADEPADVNWIPKDQVNTTSPLNEEDEIEKSKYPEVSTIQAPNSHYLSMLAAVAALLIVMVTAWSIFFNNAGEQSGSPPAARLHQALNDMGDDISDENLATLLAIAKQDIVLHPESDHVYFAVANLLEEAGQLPQAKSYYEKALAINAIHIGAISNLARIEIIEGQYNVAINRILFIVDSFSFDNPTDKLPLLKNLAWAYYANGQFPLAQNRLDELNHYAKKFNNPEFQTAALCLGTLVEKSLGNAWQALAKRCSKQRHMPLANTTVERVWVDTLNQFTLE
ncbi:MAG: hypothetical protein MI976_01685 [Pseudomonadales bacterium]|nr:hypothetical protein [Pseudomonadales bacterium]